MALHRARQAAAKCVRRELQRPPARRVPQRDPVSEPRPRPLRVASLEGRLQPRPPARRPERADAGPGRRTCAPHDPRPQQQPRAPAIAGGDQGLRSAAPKFRTQHSRERLAVPPPELAPPTGTGLGRLPRTSRHDVTIFCLQVSLKAPCRKPSSKKLFQRPTSARSLFSGQ